MKSSNTVVSIIIIAAVLLAACAVGLLVHLARMGRPQPERAVDTSSPAIQVALQRPGNREKKTDTPEQRAKLKEERAQTLAKMNSLTEEQKEEFRSQVRSQFSERNIRGFPMLSAEEREQIRREWPNMSEEQRAAWLARMGARLPGARPQPEVGPPIPVGESPKPEQSTEESSPEPNKVSQGQPSTSK